MDLNQLNYKFVVTTDGCHELSFDCPMCGPPYRVWLRCRHKGPPSPGTWAWDFDGPTITLTPSIRNNMHGRKKVCGWHGSITGGQVITESH
jgi:hypothetical protein